MDLRPEAQESSSENPPFEAVPLALGWPVYSPPSQPPLPLGRPASVGTPRSLAPLGVAVQLPLLLWSVAAWLHSASEAHLASDILSYEMSKLKMQECGNIIWHILSGKHFGNFLKNKTCNYHMAQQLHSWHLSQRSGNTYMNTCAHMFTAAFLSCPQTAASAGVLRQGSG